VSWRDGQLGEADLGAGADHANSADDEPDPYEIARRAVDAKRDFL